MHAERRGKVTSRVLLQSLMTCRLLAHKLRLTHACVLCWLQALVREGMWQSRPTNSDGLAANFVFLKDNMQDMDTFRGVETAVRGSCPCKYKLVATLAACCTTDCLSMFRQLWDTAVAQAHIAAGCAMQHGLTGPS